MLVVRVIRAPFFVINFLVSAFLVAFFLAWVSVGDWCEVGLHWLGYQKHPYWLPGVVGFAAYFGLGVAGPAYLGCHLIGWPGVLAGPLCMLVLIAVLGRW
ncbi:MAG: hypothetical protein JXB30_16680 [Anaerolineae bacterium]|nr:hypothetical protein [Anaerolineae bacterium]